MKTPEEIKQGLASCAGINEGNCKKCNYREECTLADGFSVLAYDALEYIKELEAKLKTSEFERKGLLRTVNHIVYCDECVHYHGECCDYVTYIDEHDKVHRAKDVRDGNDYCSFGERREGEDDEQQ